MRRAIGLAGENVAAGTGGPFGAVVALGGGIVGEGTNRVTAALDPTAHAEMVAIRAAAQKLGRFSLAGAELFSSCEPCPMCLAAAYWARLDRVWYAADRGDAAGVGFDDALLYDEIGLPIAGRKLPMAQLLGGEALAVMRAWRARPDRVRY